MVIAPARPWWRLELGEIWRYRDLLKELVARDLTAVYKQTILGPIWVVVQPLVTAIVFAVVFGLIARMSVPGMPALLFYLAAIVPWSFFSTVVTKTSATLIANASLTTKVYFPRLIPPMSTTCSAGFTFLVQLLCFFVFAAGYRLTGNYHWAPGPALLLLPLLVVLLVMLAFGSGLIASALTTRSKDLNFLIAFAIQLLMYASPVIFPLSKLQPGSKVHAFISANPMTPVIEGFRSALLGTSMYWASLWYTFAFASVVLVLGLAMYQRAQRSFADVV